MSRWIEDSESAECLLCKSEFSFWWNRRHHCRRCGLLVCDDCSNVNTYIPVEFLLSAPFSFTLPDPSVPHRTCKKCVRATCQPPAETSNSNHATAILQPPNSPNSPDETETRPVLVAPTTDVFALELAPGQPYKRYRVNIPEDASVGRIFRVSLGGRVMRICIPANAPGTSIIVRAPAPVERLPRAAAAQVAPISKKKGTITCADCTFDNSIELLRCEVCSADISVVTKPILPTTNVLELTPGDPVKKYYVCVPHGIRPDENFQVMLGTYLWTVICPNECEEGDQIIVCAPEVPLTAMELLTATLSQSHNHEPAPGPDVVSVSEGLSVLSVEQRQGVGRVHDRDFTNQGVGSVEGAGGLHGGPDFPRGSSSLSLDDDDDALGPQAKDDDDDDDSIEQGERKKDESFLHSPPRSGVSKPLWEEGPGLAHT